LGPISEEGGFGVAAELGVAAQELEVSDAPGSSKTAIELVLLALGVHTALVVSVTIIALHLG